VVGTVLHGADVVGGNTVKYGEWEGIMVSCWMGHLVVKGRSTSQSEGKVHVKARERESVTCP
jgi:hypothetical protein